AVALGAGDLDTAYDESFEAAQKSEVNGPAPFAVAGRAATWTGDRARVDAALQSHLASMPHGPAIELERQTMRATLLAMDGRRSEAITTYRDALDGWREIGCQFDFALTALDAVATLGSDPVLAPSTAEARRILVALRARPFIERFDALLAAGGSADAGAMSPGAGAMTPGGPGAVEDRAPRRTSAPVEPTEGSIASTPRG